MKTRALAVPAVCAVLWLLAACGGSSPASPSSPPPAPTVPVSAACTALGSTVSASTAIVNGSDCTGMASAIVLLNLRDASGQPTGACTGTVIAPRAILTAAHCLPSTTASINVFLGTGPQQPAQSFAPHPSWRESNATAFDVGVILMPADIGRTPMPLLLSRDARVGETAILTGWGKDGSGVGATLRAGTATLTGVTALTLQTTFTTAASSVCQGDSGGPILLNEGGAWAIGGVISANSTLACSFGDNFYANLRHPDISAFILARVPDAARR
jgi:secreted trypsin-like serine protease